MGFKEMRHECGRVGWDHQQPGIGRSIRPGTAVSLLQELVRAFGSSDFAPRRGQGEAP